MTKQQMICWCTYVCLFLPHVQQRHKYVKYRLIKHYYEIHKKPRNFETLFIMQGPTGHIIYPVNQNV